MFKIIFGYKQMARISLSSDKGTASFFPNEEQKYLLNISALLCQFTNEIILQGFILFVTFWTLLCFF